MGIASSRGASGQLRSSNEGDRCGRVLVVDDDASTREALESILEPHCIVTKACGGSEALDLVEGHDFDLVLLDLEMPGVGGIEVCQKLKSCPATVDLLVVIITHHGDRENQLAAYEAGATEFILKPLDAPIIVANVRQLLEARRRLQRTLLLSDARWRFALEGSEFGTWEWDTTLGQITCSSKLCSMLELPATDHRVGYEEWLAWVFPEDRARVSSHMGALERGEVTRPTTEYRLQASGGSVLWVSERTRILEHEEGRPTRISALIADKTKHRLSERKIMKLSRFDPVTDLPNRTTCLEAIGDELSADEKYSQPCLLRVDLSGLGRANQAAGRAAGDELLQQAARRLRRVAPAPHALFQFGGKEFAIVVNLPLDADAPQEAASLGEQIRDELSVPFGVHGDQLHCEARVGATIVDSRDESPEEVVRRAEVALVQAKKSESRVALFAHEMLSHLAARASLLSDLESAVSTDQFYLAYQPIVSASGKITGAEALARWKHPERGMVAPDEFISVAEESGLIVPLGARFRLKACEQLVEWSKHPATAELKLSVNVSPAEFRASGFVRDLLLLRSQYPEIAGRLQIEVTESLLLSRFSDVAEAMRNIHEQGLSFALDDFGTGYSSFSYLKKLPFQRLKLDRSFVRDILNDPVDVALSRAIIAMSHNLGLEIVAEGVEDESQVRLLSEMGCTMFQGYLFGRPGTAEALAKEARAQAAEGMSPSRSPLQTVRSSTIPPGANRRAMEASILVIDDDEMTLELVRHVLDDYPNLQASSCPVEGRAMAEASPPDLLILDRTMGESSGLDLWSELRKNPALVDVPVIFITYADDPECEIRAFSLGAADYVHKPISAARLRVAVANQIQKKRHADRLREQASIDPLTGVANRRSFSRALDREIDRADETGTPLSLLMIDVDNFKTINDTFGHIAGDVCLEELGSLMRDNFGSTTNMVSRYGGEEFAILMSLSDSEAAELLSEELVRAVAMSRIGTTAGIDRAVTISVGWATVEPRTWGADPAHELVQAADGALLCAKASGKNRACGAGVKLPARSFEMETA